MSGKLSNSSCLPTCRRKADEIKPLSLDMSIDFFWTQSSLSERTSRWIFFDWLSQNFLESVLSRLLLRFFFLSGLASNPDWQQARTTVVSHVTSVWRRTSAARLRSLRGLDGMHGGLTHWLLTVLFSCLCPRLLRLSSGFDSLLSDAISAFTKF